MAGWEAPPQRGLTKAAHDFVQTPKRRAHRATVTFDENAETPRAPLQREESAFIGAGRVGAAVLSKQLSGTGHYGVESDTSPYVATCCSRSAHLRRVRKWRTKRCTRQVALTACRKRRRIILRR